MEGQPEWSDPEETSVYKQGLELQLISRRNLREQNEAPGGKSILYISVPQLQMSQLSGIGVQEEVAN